MIATLLALSSGVVLIGGRDVSSLSGREASAFRLSEFGFVHQNFDLLPGVTAIDNAAPLLEASANVVGPVGSKSVELVGADASLSGQTGWSGRVDPRAR
jgi:ABC-type lipoprotein export system ATPase subunit